MSNCCVRLSADWEWLRVTLPAGKQGWMPERAFEWRRPSFKTGASPVVGGDPHIVQLMLNMAPHSER